MHNALFWCKSKIDQEKPRKFSWLDLGSKFLCSQSDNQMAPNTSQAEVRFQDLQSLDTFRLATLSTSMTYVHVYEKCPI